MYPFAKSLSLSACALAAALLVSACGGADPADTTPPTVTITDDVADATATGKVTFTFTFSEDIKDTLLSAFTAGDVVVSGGTAGTFTKLSSTAYTLEVTPDSNAVGTITVSVAANKFDDLEGNANSASASASQDYNTVPVPSSLPVTFDGTEVTYALTGFGGAEDSTVVTDPSGGTNKVAKVMKSATAELWAGTTVSTGANNSIATIPFTATAKTMTLRVYTPASGIMVRLKVEDAADKTKSVETEATTTVAGGWETLTFNFANQVSGTAALNLSTTYNKASVFFNFGKAGADGGAGTYYFDDLTFGSSPVASSLPVTFDGTEVTYALTGFGGAEDSTVVTDPSGGTNKVAKVMKSATAELWAGTTVSTGANNSIATIPFTATAKTMTMRVYTPASGIVVRLKVEDAADKTKSVETEATTTVAGGWETLTFNFANQVSGTAALNLSTTYNKASVFFNFGKAGADGGAGTYYFDDLTFGSSPVASSLPVTFDGTEVTYALTGFGGAEDSTVVTDPSGGTNKVAKVMKSATAELWAGTTVSTGANNSIATIPFTATAKTMTLRVYTPASGIMVRLKVEDAADKTKSVETEATTTVAGGWETLTFNFANQVSGTAALNLSTTYNKASVFFNFGKAGADGGAGTYYFDDLTFVAP